MNYIGSKKSLLPFIEKTVFDLGYRDNEGLVLCDAFAGTGAVSRRFREKGWNVISNDLMSYSYFRNYSYLCLDEVPSFARFNSEFGRDIWEHLNGCAEMGFIYDNYSPSGRNEYDRLYFSESNAMKIDGIRLAIERLLRDGFLLESEYNYLIASLLESADRVANVASVYASYLKRLKKTASAPLVLKPLDLGSLRGCYVGSCSQMDANQFVVTAIGDVLYLDPPYNTRQYSDYYHLLETIALYDSPVIRGKTGVRVDEMKKSDYSSKRKVKGALRDLLSKANFKHILLSYNEEGLLSLDEIEKLFRGLGNYSLVSMEYNRFKADSGRTCAKDTVMEYIHVLEKQLF